MAASSTAERDYLKASDQQLVAWANEGDAEAFDHSMGAVRVYTLDGTPEQACKIISCLAQSVLDRAEADSLFQAGRAFDKAGAHSEALKWFLRASEKGHVVAGFYAGVIYANKEDWNNALSQYKLSADRGDPDAQYMTAMFLSCGRAGATDTIEALRYCELAAKQGQKQALENLDDYREEASVAARKKKSIWAFLHRR